MRNLAKILGVAFLIFLAYLLIGKYREVISSRIFGNNQITGNFIKIEQYLNNQTLSIELDGNIKNYSLGKMIGRVILLEVSGKLNNFTFYSKEMRIDNFYGDASGGNFSKIMAGNFELEGNGEISFTNFNGISISGTFDVVLEGFEGRLKILSENITIKKYSFKFEEMNGTLEIKDGKVHVKGVAKKVSFWS